MFMVSMIPCLFEGKRNTSLIIVFVSMLYIGIYLSFFLKQVIYIGKYSLLSFGWMHKRKGARQYLIMIQLKGHQNISQQYTISYKINLTQTILHKNSLACKFYSCLYRPLLPRWWSLLRMLSFLERHNPAHQLLNNELFVPY